MINIDENGSIVIYCSYYKPTTYGGCSGTTHCEINCGDINFVCWDNGRIEFTWTDIILIGKKNIRIVKNELVL
jgi:hypothetical protein